MNWWRFQENPFPGNQSFMVRRPLDRWLERSSSSFVAICCSLCSRNSTVVRQGLIVHIQWRDVKGIRNVNFIYTCQNLPRCLLWGNIEVAGLQCKSFWACKLDSNSAKFGKFWKWICKQTEDAINPWLRSGEIRILFGCRTLWGRPGGNHFTLLVNCTNFSSSEVLPLIQCDGDLRFVAGAGGPHRLWSRRQLGWFRSTWCLQ